MSDNPSKAAEGRAGRPVDRRDEAVGATLVGLVVVLLGFASGIGAGGSGTEVAGGGSQAPTTAGSLSGAPTPAGPPALIQASSSASAGGDQYPPTGGLPVGPNQSSAPVPVGATSGPVAGPPGPPSSVPSTPMPTPTSVISGPPYPTSTGPSTSVPSSPDGSPSTPPPVVISGDPSSPPATDVLSCLLDPITAPLGGLLGLGNVLGSCPSSPGGLS